MKLKKYIFLSLMICLTIIPNKIYALSYANVCSNKEVLNVVRIIGICIYIIKIVIPLLIIIFGMFDFAKVVISKDEKEINKSTNKLVKRVIAGILIYFLPTIILTLFDYLKLSDIHTKENYYDCTICLLNTKKCEKE